MTALLRKAIILGILTGLMGLGANFLPYGLDLEENVGLEVLFHLRGVRQPPPEVVVIGIDKVSADNLGLPNDSRKWPRSFYARITEILKAQGAAVVAFDVVFEDPRSPEEDNDFAAAVARARNVVLCERIRTEKIPLADRGGSRQGDLSIVKLVPPIPPLEQSAVALAPFPLPKVPVKVSQYWTFKTGAGDTPTLPVVAFQLYAMDIYDEFISSLAKVSSYPLDKFLLDKTQAINTRSVRRLISGIRDVFEKEPVSSARLLEELIRSKIPASDAGRLKLITALVKMYGGSNSQYLNFYGPPRTITTIPYYQAMRLQEGAAGSGLPDFRGKAVFVGLSELVQPEQKDGFNTVFTQSDGLDIAGVEIAATAFANLLEDMPVRPLGIPAHVVFILVWGLVIGILSRLYSNAVAALSVVGLCVLYLAAAEYQFKSAG
ncbi:MAG TPA: CHASE2 domain-containing protein, partial [Thermodesulfovibrionales bacterium]|nr:CHASE2 domain-containing protein [Thermodesulfovibrionales bacterium]